MVSEGVSRSVEVKHTDSVFDFRLFQGFGPKLMWNKNAYLEDFFGKSTYICTCLQLCHQGK